MHHHPSSWSLVVAASCCMEALSAAAVWSYRRSNACRKEKYFTENPSAMLFLLEEEEKATHRQINRNVTFSFVIWSTKKESVGSCSVQTWGSNPQEAGTAADSERSHEGYECLADLSTPPSKASEDAEKHPAVRTFLARILLLEIF